MIVPVALNVIRPVADHTVVADKVKLPAIVGVPVELNVNELPVVVSDLAVNAPVSVTVPDPEEPSKNTSSTMVGTLAPLAPPVVALQLVVDDVFQVPAPPTQYLLAITGPEFRFEVQKLPASWTSVVVSWLQFALLSRPPLLRLTKPKHRKIIRIGFQIEN